MDINYGTTTGYSHRRLDYNNQDAVFVIENENYSIGIIADGCGSGTNSEVGAQLGVRFIGKMISECIDNRKDWKPVIKHKIHQYSQTFADVHSVNRTDFFRNYLLYTVIGFVKAGDMITIFHCGDGVVAIGEDVNLIDQKNRPKYVNNELVGEPEGEFEFQEFTYSGQHILIGSDGVEDLIRAIEKDEISEFRDVNDFINSEMLFENPIELPRFLQRYSKKGVLKDDSSIIVLREL